jgi:SAM-dependent methyltransferase
VQRFTRRFDVYRLHVNRRFILNRARDHRPGGRILDFGCSDASGIEWGRREGVEVVGVDIKPITEDPLLYVCTPTELPFDDDSFDAIVSNMVFEHVMHPVEVLAELHRVLRPGGIMINLWPSSEATFEGHCRLFFAQNLRSESYLRACYRLGLGKRGAKRKTSRQYAQKWLRYMEEECNYLPRAELVAAFERAGFSFHHAEHDYLEYRFGRTFPGADRLLRKLTTMVVISRRLEN